MVVVVIGANSELSQEIIKRFNENGSHQIFGVYNKNIDNLKAPANYQSIENLKELPSSIDFLFFIAAYIPSSKEENSKKLCEVNVLLLQRVIDYFNYKKLIYASSVAVYRTSDMIISECSEIEPATGYGKSKRQAELICQNRGKYAIVRLTSMVSDLSGSRSYLTRAIQQAKSKGEIKVFGNGIRKQNYISAKDCSEYFYKSAFYSKDGIFLASGKLSYSNIEIAEMIQQKVSKCKIIFMGMDQSPSFEYDNKKTRDVLNIQEETEVRMLIEKIV